MKSLLTYVAFFGFAVSAFAQAPSAPPLSQLFAFYCTPNYATCPYGFQPGPGPIQLANGNLYGATAYSASGNGGGTVWQANLSGDVNTLYNFSPNGSGQYPNGEVPSNGLVAGADGNLYGVTALGGANDAGVFYSLTTAGTQQILYSFCSLSGCPDQAFPIVLGGDGNFYGITPEFVFQLTPDGVWSQFYNFHLPSSAGVLLIAGTDGNLYGVASSFAPKVRESIFRLTTGGVYTTVHTFPKNAGATVLTQSSNGTLYGVFNNEKTGIFEISTAGTYKVLQKTPQGAYPPTLLLEGSDGNLYGLINDLNVYPPYPGAVFAITPKGKTIFSEEFDCNTVGCDVLSLIEASDGNFYGLAVQGGTVAPGDIQNGTIFKVATGLKER
ncbi:MAG: choice-of-anchor tandem repeat GloVer-containing protein [Terriglobales bacterium]|jgi:uncharacterized repeat protein (TIGR03803 family)